MKIINNFLDYEYQDHLEKILLIRENFPWYLHHSSNYGPENYDDYVEFNSGLPLEKEHPQFVHLFYNDEKQNSDFFPTIGKFFKSNIHFEIERFFRIKANLNIQIPNQLKDIHGPLHRDSPHDYLESILYYVNDSDGETLFFDNDRNLIKKVKPKKGRAIIFDSNIIHAASSPINCRFKVVINCIVYKKNRLNTSTNKLSRF